VRSVPGSGDCDRVLVGGDPVKLSMQAIVHCYGVSFHALWPASIQLSVSLVPLLF
jgi:hypothetical protein